MKSIAWAILVATIYFTGNYRKVSDKPWDEPAKRFMTGLLVGCSIGFIWSLF